MNITRIRRSFAIAFVLLACRPAGSVRADERTKSDRDAFKGRILLARLRAERARYVAMAEPALAASEKRAQRAIDANSQKIRIMGAEASYQQAKLTREVAELALREYNEGTFIKQKAAIDAQRDTAEDLRKSAEKGREKTRQARIAFQDSKPAAGLEMIGSLLFDQAERRYEDTIEHARLTRELGESRLNLLLQFEKPGRIKELESEIEKCKTDERSKQQSLAMERDRLDVLERAIAKDRPSPEETRLLALLDEGAGLDAKLRADLDASKGEPSETKREEIVDRLDEIRAKLDEAGRLADALKARRDDLRYEEFKARVSRAARRP